MKQILTVCNYTIKDAIQKKAFLISTLIIALLILGVCAVPKITDFFGIGKTADVAEAPSDGDSGLNVTASEEALSETAPKSAASSVCYYIDPGHLIPDGPAALMAAHPDISVEAASPEKAAEFKTQIAEDKHLSMIQITEENGLPLIQLTTKDFMSSLGASTVSDILTKAYVASVLKSKGVDEETAQLVQTELPCQMETAGKMDMTGYVAGIVMTLLMFFAVYYYGYGVSMSIATEKTSRVMETLVVSAKPSRILIGKCLGMGLVGLMQFAGLLLFAALCYKLLIPADQLFMGVSISLSFFTPKIVILLVAYFILGYALYAVLNSVCGATVSKIEDLQSAMMPVTLIVIVSFYLGYMSAILGSTESDFIQKLAMYLPFSSPFSMPFKLLNGSVSNLDLAVSLILLVIAILAISALSIRFYSASVLHYGKRMRLKNIFKTKA